MTDELNELRKSRRLLEKADQLAHDVELVRETINGLTAIISAQTKRAHKVEDENERLKDTINDLNDVIASAVRKVERYAPEEWKGPMMPGDAPAHFIDWQAIEIAERDKHIAELTRLLRAAVDQCPAWSTDEAFEADALLSELSHD